MEEQVTISLEEYKELLRDRLFVQALEENHVYIWSGYIDSWNTYQRNIKQEGL
jgi:hypothetical protein